MASNKWAARGCLFHMFHMMFSLPKALVTKKILRICRCLHLKRITLGPLTLWPPEAIEAINLWISWWLVPAKPRESQLYGLVPIYCAWCVQLYLEAMYSSGLRCSLIEGWAPGGNLRDPNGLCQQILARGYLRMPAASQIIPALLTIWYNVLWPSLLRNLCAKVLQFINLKCKSWESLHCKVTL